MRIDAGSGQFPWNRGVHGQIDLEQVEASGFRTGKLALRTDIASQRELTAHATAQQIRGSAGGGEIALESVVFDVSREPGAAGDPVTSRTAIRNLRFSSTGTEASLAELSAQITGLLRPDHFQGTFAFAAPSASLRPLRLLARSFRRHSRDCRSTVATRSVRRIVSAAADSRPDRSQCGHPTAGLSCGSSAQSDCT